MKKDTLDFLRRLISLIGICFSLACVFYGIARAYGYLQRSLESQVTVAVSSIQATSAPLPYLTDPTSSIYLEGASASTTCFVAESGSCLLTFRQLAAMASLARAVDGGSFTVAADHVSVPVTATSTTDLLTVLNRVEAQIGQVSAAEGGK